MSAVLLHGGKGIIRNPVNGKGGGRASFLCWRSKDFLFKSSVLG
jgi:hypothetical protein